MSDAFLGHNMNLNCRKTLFSPCTVVLSKDMSMNNPTNPTPTSKGIFLLGVQGNKIEFRHGPTYLCYGKVTNSFLSNGGRYLSFSYLLLSLLLVLRFFFSFSNRLLS